MIARPRHHPGRQLWAVIRPKKTGCGTDAGHFRYWSFHAHL